MTDPIANIRTILAQPETVDLPEDMAPTDPQGEAPTETGAGHDDREPPPAEAEPPAPEAVCAAFALNDTGNGQRFVVHFGEDVLWVPRVGWFNWDGQVWKSDPDKIAVRRLAQQLGPLIDREIAHLTLEPWQMDLLTEEPTLTAERAGLVSQTDEQGQLPDAVQDRLRQIDTRLNRAAGLKESLTKMRVAHRNFAKTAGNSGRMDCALTEAGVNISRQVDDLDADPLQVNTLSGVLQFAVSGGPGEGFSRTATMTLLPHDRKHLLTKIMPVEYDPDATAPTWDAFLNRIQPDGAMRGFIQRWFGLSMTALTNEQKLVFQYGLGANGKSVLADTIARLMGAYASTAKIESLTGKNRRGGADATPDLMPLIGARMVRASEPEEGERLQEGTIKELTGGEPILVRALNKDFVEVRPHFKLTISGNHKPEIRGTDDGIWRRLLLVPFDVQIPEAERDPDLGRKLWEERAGILNWLIEGLWQYLEGGLQEPFQVLDATRVYREESDPVGAFLEAACLVTGDPADTIGARELGEAFNFWLDDQGMGQWKDRTVATRLKDKSRSWRSPTTGKGFVARKASTMAYDGIRLDDIFGKRFRNASRDQHGRIIRTKVSEADE